ncbi:MAG: N-6 DNA methylase, partial [Promethearchaeota archaeon]
MKDFSDYLEKEDLLKELFEYYRVDPEELERENFLFNLIKELDIHSRETEVLNSNHDFLGGIYEDFLKRGERKALGQYYTPKSVVNYMLEAVRYKFTNEIENKKLMDLSCGVGNFVIQAIRILILRFLEIYKRKETQELLLHEAKFII